MAPKAITMGAALVAAFFIGWLVKPAPVIQDRTTRTNSDDSVIPRTEYDRLEAELKVERKQRADLEQRIEKLRAPDRQPAAPDEPGARRTVAATTGPRFHYDKYEDALKQVDWKVVGESLTEMPPLMALLFDALRNGKPMPPSVGRIQRYNGPLVEQGMKMMQAGIPGETVNAVFTHPAAQVNMVYATLRHAGKPLNTNQEERLGEVGARFMELDDQRVAAYEPNTMGLEKLIGETALKDKFYAAVDELLTAAQRVVLHPPATAGYISADLFSSGLVWGPNTRPFMFAGLEELESKMMSQVAGRLELDASGRATAKQIVGAWARSLSPQYLAVAADALVSKRLIKVDRVRAAAHAQLKLQHALMGQLNLTDKQRNALRGSTRVLVPFAQPSADAN